MTAQLGDEARARGGGTGNGWLIHIEVKVKRLSTRRTAPLIKGWKVVDLILSRTISLIASVVPYRGTPSLRETHHPTLSSDLSLLVRTKVPVGRVVTD